MIRAFTPGDEIGILELYRIVFGIELTLPEWHWYYGRGAIIVVAEADHRIVGHYAVQPRPFWVGARRCQAGLVMGSMVAPQFRNITTFVEMARLAYARCRDAAIDFVYAFPNDNVWLVRRRMLDWQALPSIVALAAAVSELRVVSEASASPLSPGDPAPQAPWLDAPGDGAIRAAQPPDFLDWRFRRRPGLDYPVYVHREAGTVRGYIALKHYENGGHVEGHVMAVRVEPGVEARVGAALLSLARAHFHAVGIERVSLWMLPASPLHAVATSAGFLPVPGPGKNFGYLPLDPSLAGELAQAERWDITMADSDVF